MKKPKKLRTKPIVKKTMLDKYLESKGNLSSINEHPLIIDAFSKISKGDDIVSEDTKDWQEATLIYGQLIEEVVIFMSNN